MTSVAKFDDSQLTKFIENLEKRRKETNQDDSIDVVAITGNMNMSWKRNTGYSTVFPGELPYISKAPAFVRKDGKVLGAHMRDTSQDRALRHFENTIQDWKTQMKVACDKLKRPSVGSILNKQDSI